jgi:putrescine transport system substrate-binding protein
MLRPEIAARNSNFVNYANGNQAAQELLDEKVRADPAVYPDETVLGNLYTTTPSDPRTQREVTRIWTEVKTGQ